MGGILGYFTRHATAANLVLVLMVVFGLAALPQMRAQYFPDVVVDEIDVDIAWDGAGPEDVDRAVIEPVLPALMAVEGLATASSRASEGKAKIELEFEPGWDMERAVADVKAAVDGVTTLPEDSDPPEVTRSVWRDRVTDVVISGPVGVDQLARFADEFTQRLFSEGVTRTTIRGVAAPQTVVEVRTLDLMRHDITMAELARVIEVAADTTPAGDVTGANARVRTGTERRAADQVAGVPIKILDDGSALTVGDVATVRQEGPDRARSYFVDGNPAISIRVDRSPQGDAIAIQRQVEAAAEAMKTGLPPEMRIDLIRTRAEQITQRLEILVSNGLQGLALVLILLFLFLNARTALWVAAGIPVSMLTALGLMWAGGLTLNMMSLFGLIITLGIVVDDAIVVGEHADYRYRHLGEGPYGSAERAARRMFLPVLSATLTTVIAFFGLTAIGGRFGEMISDIPFTVIAVLLASLAECFLILPSHMAHALAAGDGGLIPWYDRPSHWVNKGFGRLRDGAFRRFVALVLRGRYVVVSAALLLLATQIVPLISGELRWRFFSPPEQASVDGNFAMMPLATRGDSFAQMRELERAVAKVGADLQAEYGVNPVTYVVTEVGGNTGRGLEGTENTDADLLGSIAIELVDRDARPFDASLFVSRLQAEARQLPLAETLSFRSWRYGSGSDNLDVQLYGADLRQLKIAAEALKARLAQYPEISSIQDNLPFDKDQYVLDLTSKGRALGFTTEELGQVLRNRLNGIEAATYPAGLRTGTIRVELPEGERAADFLDSMMLKAGSGQYVPLTDLVTVTREGGFGTIRREDGLAVLSVTGNLSDDDPARASVIEAELRDELLPAFAETAQVNYRFAGMAADEARFLADAETGFILCLLGIYLVLAWIFASWTRPLVIMAIIPFGLVGAFWGHRIWDMSVSMFSVIGLIGMTGIIINDSIVLISSIDERARSRGLVPAILDGTAERLRPVLLTTLTTVLGLAPLMYESSRAAEFLKPTVITLVYGLGFGMVLVLLLVPALLAIGLDLRQALASQRRALDRRSGPGRAVAALYAVLAAGWFWATLGSRMISGASPAMAHLGLGQGLGATYLVFAAGAAAVGLAVLAGAAAVLALARRRPA
ncbi:efflux RND transporter permease subunit [Mangrovicoccus sp. HB161399]|uniref:efflux RND transporter permease subunit n=1 Tax=Mangrovicoccus sp. HB161399 TaxID=2720392 RepID=UPI0015566E3B|nr:efflux RND transporter permease subunit [Mangrovicoccus sp. HB161399]